MNDPTTEAPGLDWNVRQATASDAPELVRQRVLFLREAGDPDPEAIRDTFRDYLERKMPAGDFLAWVAEAGGQIVATSGLIVVDKPPAGWNPSGREGYVMNMYTLPEWRRHGIAACLLSRAIAYLKERGIRCVRLHATPAGRPIYERMGFAGLDSEMLARW
jgi:GNAT superfamily N-acetyltransferase